MCIWGPQLYRLIYTQFDTTLTSHQQDISNSYVQRIRERSLLWIVHGHHNAQSSLLSRYKYYVYSCCVGCLQCSNKLHSEYTLDAKPRVSIVRCGLFVVAVDVRWFACCCSALRPAASSMCADRASRRVVCLRRPVRVFRTVLLPLSLAEQQQPRAPTSAQLVITLNYSIYWCMRCVYY